MKIDKERIEAWVSEWNLIQQKKSKLSRKQRDKVEEIVKYLVDEGVITPTEVTKIDK
jgi:hypothetical protein